MTIGLIGETERPRYQNNERFDEEDAQAESELRLVREAMVNLAALGGPLGFVSAFGETIGMVLQGGSITGSAGPGTVTLGSELFVAFDADGNLLIKSAATGSLTTNAEPGVSTIYAYAADAPSKMALRAFIPAVSPFDEFFESMNTRFVSQIGLVSISGDATVDSATINGVTKALVAVALVNNVAGTVTITKQYTNVLQTVRPLSVKLTDDGGFFISVAPGVIGATTWAYVVVARGRKGEVLKVSAPLSISNGPAILSSVNFVNIGWTPLPEAQDYLIYRTTAGGTPNTIGLITPTPIVAPPGQTGGVSFNDTGFAGDSTTPPASTTEPVVVPTSSTDRGAGGSTSLSVLGLLRTVASLLADVKFKRSMLGTQPNKQTASSNYGLYGSIRRGLDAVDRSSNLVWTVGDGLYSFGDFDLSNYSGDFGALLTDLFAQISAAQQLFNLKMLNEKYVVVLKGSGTNYALTGDIVAPNNIIIMGEQPVSALPTFTSTSFALNNGALAPTLGLAGHKLTLGVGCEMKNLFVRGGTAAGSQGAVVLSGKNLVQECLFLQSYSLGAAIGTADAVLQTSASIPMGGISGITVDRCVFRCHNNFGSAVAAYQTGLAFTSVRDCVIKDSQFITDTGRSTYISSNRPTPSTMLTLTSSVDNIRVTGCRFDMYDDPVQNATAGFGAYPIAGMQAAMHITAAANAGAARRILVDKCTFGCRNANTNALLASIPYINLGGGYEYRGLQIDEEINVEVYECEFTNLVYGIAIGCNGGTYAYDDMNFHDNVFRQIGVAGIFLENTGAGTVLVTGWTIDKNIFEDMQFGILVNIDPQITLPTSTGFWKTIQMRDCSMSRNKFKNFIGTAGIAGATITPYANAIFIVADQLLNFRCEDNYSENLLSGFFMATYRTSSILAWQNVSICRNKGYNIFQDGFNYITAGGQQDKPGVAGFITLTSTTISDNFGVYNNIRICDNQVTLYDTRSSASTTSVAQAPIAVIGATLEEIQISNNSLYQCGHVWTGGNRVPHILVEHGSLAAGAYTRNLQVHNNILGDATSQLDAVNVRARLNGAATQISAGISIQGNVWHANWAAGSASGTVAIFQIGVTITSEHFATVNISNNTLHFHTTVTNLSRDSFVVQAEVLYGCILAENLIMIDSTVTGFSSTGANAIVTTPSDATYKVIGNTSTNAAGTSTGFTYAGEFASGTAGYFVGNT